MARLLLLGAVTLTVVEGAIRKWVLGSEAGAWSHLIYFSKDLFFAGLLLLPRRQQPTAEMALFRRWLFIGGGLVALGGAIAACRSVNPVGAALTLRATIVLPAIACAAVPRLCGLKLLPVAASVGALTCVNCGLGILQNHLPADHLLNRYAGNETEVAVLESGVRATGTFAYITGLAVLSSVGIWAGLAMTSLAAEGLGMGAGAVTILASIGCGLASVSRGPLVVGAVLLASWPVFVSYRSGRLLKPFWTSALITLAGLVLSLVPEARQMTLAVLERHEQGEDTFQQRVFGQFSQAAAAAAIAPLGEGLGTEQVAGNYAAAGAMRFTTFEDQLPRLILETGVFGTMGFIIICVGALRSLQLAKESASDPQARAILLATQVLLGCLFYVNMVFNHTVAAFAWIIFAAVMGATARPCRPLARAPNSRVRNRLRRSRFAG
jgi:hypothetical protein